MNGKRIVIGGLVAGVAMGPLDFVTNEIVFKKDWADAYAALRLAPSEAALGAFWTTVDLASGVAIAFLYAAMRPRFGPGPKTGAIAGVMVWLPLHLGLWSHFVDGVFPPRALAGAGALELVSALVGGWVAGRLYVERGAKSRSKG